MRTLTAAHLALQYLSREDNQRMMASARAASGPGSRLLFQSASKQAVANAPSGTSELLKTWKFGTEEVELRPFLAECGWQPEVTEQRKGFAGRMEVAGRRIYRVTSRAMGGQHGGSWFVAASTITAVDTEASPAVR